MRLKFRRVKGRALSPAECCKAAGDVALADKVLAGLIKDLGIRKYERLCKPDTFLAHFRTPTRRKDKQRVMETRATLALAWMHYKTVNSGLPLLPV